jgi:hypothetical protein
MKKVILLVVACCFCQLILAQESEPKKTQLPALKHEFGANLASYGNPWGSTPYHLYLYNAMDKPYGHVLTGIYYRYHFGKNAMRLSYDYYQRMLYSYFYEGYGTHNFEAIAGKIFAHELRAGYERHFGKKRWQLIVLSDLVFNYLKVRGAHFGYDDYSTRRGFIWSDPPYHYYNSLNTEKFVVGVAPGIGFTCRLSKHITLRCEGSVESSLVFQPGQNWKWEKINVNPIKTFGIAYAF